VKNQTRYNFGAFLDGAHSEVKYNDITEMREWRVFLGNPLESAAVASGGYATFGRRRRRRCRRTSPVSLAGMKKKGAWTISVSI
jgi:hypothetical protein